VVGCSNAVSDVADLAEELDMGMAACIASGVYGACSVRGLRSLNEVVGLAARRPCEDTTPVVMDFIRAMKEGPCAKVAGPIVIAPIHFHPSAWCKATSSPKAEHRWQCNGYAAIAQDNHAIRVAVDDPELFPMVESCSGPPCCEPATCCPSIATGRSLWVWGVVDRASDNSLWLNVLVRPGSPIGSGYCLQTTPAGLLGHYRAEVRLAGKLALQGRAEMKRDAESETWSLLVSNANPVTPTTNPGAPMPAPWQLDDQNATDIEIGDGEISLSFRLRHADTNKEITVRAELDSIRSRLVGPFAPTNGSAEPTGTLTLQACVNEDFPGPC